MIISLNIPQWTIIIFYFLIAATIAIALYIILAMAVMTLIQGIKWVLTEDKKDETN
ncbi:hypothetical protein [Pseudobutyrivibrio sp.]